MIKKRKTTYFIINGLILLVLVLIIINQTVWLLNMYRLHVREVSALSNSAAQKAVLKELAERTEEIGGHRVFSTNINMSKPNDTARYITKKIVSEDSTYVFMIDKQDPNVVNKVIQFLLKNNYPANLNRLNAIFVEEIAPFYEVENTFFEYIDLKNGSLLDTNKPENILSARYLKTDTIPLDIYHSIGVVGHVKVVSDTILNKMVYQLIFSVLLVFIAAVCLYYISRSFIFQWKSEKMRQESINAMTHEFKRPIAGAVAMISTIPHYLEKNDIRKVLGYTQSVENELKKLTHYTQRIRQISNNEKQNANLEKTTMEILPFFKSLRQRYGATSEDGGRKVVVNLHINTSKKELRVDPLHFSNVMDNLIENAIKYSIQPTVIVDIEVADTVNGIRISVRDNGIGISPMDEKRIFDKYYRVKREETKNRVGFGLGLTYVKSIIEAHGGNITVNSSLNDGSEFIITLEE